MNNEVKIRVDEMLAAIKAAPHLNLSLYAVNVCRQSLANDLNVDEEIIGDLISEYGIDEGEISAFFQLAQGALTTYQLYQDEDEFDAKFDELQEQIDFNDAVMALSKCLILAAIDYHRNGER